MIRRPPRSTPFPTRRSSDLRASSTPSFSPPPRVRRLTVGSPPRSGRCAGHAPSRTEQGLWQRSEEHTSELQSRQYLVCRLLLEKKKKIPIFRRMSKYNIFPH